MKSQPTTKKKKVSDHEAPHLILVDDEPEEEKEDKLKGFISKLWADTLFGRIFETFTSCISFISSLGYVVLSYTDHA